jgi:hypothetical protein
MFKSKAVFAVEPNFSTHEQMQFPVALYKIYQKRWLARYWQMNGLGIFADLYVAKQHQWINLHGIPDGWQSFATSANDSRLDILNDHLNIAKRIANGNPLRMMVYGGSHLTAKFCEINDLIHIRDARNEARDGKRKQQ